MAYGGLGSEQYKAINPLNKANQMKSHDRLQHLRTVRQLFGPVIAASSAANTILRSVLAAMISANADSESMAATELCIKCAIHQQQHCEMLTLLLLAAIVDACTADAGWPGTS